MSSKICAKCGKENSAQMSFCSNCGNPLSAPPANTSKYTEDPPPTVFMGQSPPKPSDSPFGQAGGSGSSNPPNNPFNTPPTPNSPFGQAGQNAPFGQPQQPQNNPFGQNQPNSPPFTPNVPNVPNPQFTPPAATPPQPPTKSNKGLIFGAIGCLGLLVLSVVGLGIVAFVFGDELVGKKNNYPSPTPFTSNTSTANTKSSPSTTPFGSNKTSTETDSDSSSLLLSILESRKKVGSYNQTDAKTVVVGDYFPKGNGAAQAAYSSGSKSVYLTVGKFDTIDDAKANFNDQISGIKANGGKVTYQNTASDGTISAIYEKGGYYFAEYCNTNNYCNRIHSNNRDALRAFFQSYAGTK